MDKLIRYTKLNFIPSKQHGSVFNVDKMVDEAQEWMMGMISHENFPSGGIDLDLFRKEMYEWYLMNYGR